MSRRVAVQLYYDVTSPYTWLAFEVLCRYRRPWQMDLKLQPVFLGGIMNTSGNTPPGFLPARGRYMTKDLKRLSSFMDVPVQSSDECWQYIISKGTLQAQRFLTAVDQNSNEHLEEISRRLWMRLWSKPSQEIHEQQTFMKICIDVGLSQQKAEELCELAKTVEIKDRLKARTQDVLDIGAFGLPVITTQLPQFEKPQMFFGSDRLELLAHCLEKPWLGPSPEQQSKL